MGAKHLELQRTAIHWLYHRGCDVFANEVPWGGETADAIGMKFTDYTHTKSRIYTIEAKASRADLLSLKQKAVYARFCQRPHSHFYYIIVAEGVDVEPILYPLWGVINEQGRVIRKAIRQDPSDDTGRDLARAIAHVLVYKVFGKLYMTT